MGLKFKLAGLLMIAMALTTTVVAIDLLKGVTLWDVAEMRYDDPIWDRHYKIEDYHPVPWRFESTDANAQTGVVEAQGLWVGTWWEVGPCTIFCQMTSQDDAWYLTFVNSKYFVAYMRYNEDYLYRFGHLRGVGGQPSKSSAITPSPATLNGSISMEQDTDRPGMNYKDYAISSADPQICANDCVNDPNCMAFTYVKPGVRGSDSAPECWLKNGVPNPVSGECCVSGVK